MSVIYNAKLRFLKITQKMAVYGDGHTLTAQYIPKSLFGDETTGDFPEVIEVTIAVPKSKSPNGKAKTKSSKAGTAKHSTAYSEPEEEDFVN
jgi:hypothetical protein